MKSDISDKIDQLYNPAIPKEAIGTLTFEVGRLLCGRVRDFLKQCQFRGMGIEWLESSGFIEREFTVKGKKEDLLRIKTSLEEAFQRIGVETE